MIRKLRLKFICVNMLIVTLMLTAIFGMVYHLTRQGLETQSEAMLQSVASDAFHPNRPGSPPQEVHLPFFVLELDGNGGLAASGGGWPPTPTLLPVSSGNTACGTAAASRPVESASLSQICPANGPL